MKNHNQLNRESQEYVEQLPEALVAAWEEYTQRRETPVGLRVFYGMNLYEGFDYFLERILEDVEEV